MITKIMTKLIKAAIAPIPATVPIAPSGPESGVENATAAQNTPIMRNKNPSANKIFLLIVFINPKLGLIACQRFHRDIYPALALRRIIYPYLERE